MDWKCFAGKQSVLLKRTLQCKQQFVHFVTIWRCFSWAGVTIYYPAKSSLDCCRIFGSGKWTVPRSIFRWHEWILLMQFTGEIVLMLSWVTKGGFVRHQNCWHWWCFLLHWDSSEQGLVFFPSWHHKQHGCLFWCVVTALGDRLLRPTVVVNFISPHRKQGETKESTKITLLAKYFIDTDLPVILRAFSGLTESCLYSGQKESLFLSEFECPRFWLLLEHPSESTILRTEKDSNGFFLIKICFWFINYSHWGNASEVMLSFWTRTLCVWGRGQKREREMGYLQESAF